MTLSTYRLAKQTAANKKKYILFLVGLIKLITSPILLQQPRTDNVLSFCNRKHVFLGGKGGGNGFGGDVLSSGGFFSFEEKAHSFKVV
jgi:hypothetical protein